MLQWKLNLELLLQVVKKKRVAKAAEKSRDLSQALWTFYKSDEFRAQDYAEFQEVEQACRQYKAHPHELHASHKAYRESFRITCGWAIDVTEIMLSLIEGSTGPLPDHTKKEIDTFTDKIAHE